MSSIWNQCHHNWNRLQDEPNLEILGSCPKMGRVHFADSHFADISHCRHITLPTVTLPTYHFADISLCRQSLCRHITLPTYHFADSHFADISLCRHITLPTGTLYRQVHFACKICSYPESECVGVGEGVHALAVTVTLMHTFTLRIRTNFAGKVYLSVECTCRQSVPVGKVTVGKVTRTQKQILFDVIKWLANVWN